MVCLNDTQRASVKTEHQHGDEEMPASAESLGDAGNDRVRESGVPEGRIHDVDEEDDNKELPIRRKGGEAPLVA
jgi:hypothetical protein